MRIARDHCLAPGRVEAPIHGVRYRSLFPDLPALEADLEYIPFEFADAAYRYGHAQIRPRYEVNARFGPLPVFPDLMGFRPVTPERTVDWTLQIDVAGHPAAQRAKRIDSRLPAALIALPTQISGSEPGTDYASLANRDLQRGQAVGLASGEAIARQLDVPPLTAAQLGLAERGWTGDILVPPR